MLAWVVARWGDSFGVRGVGPEGGSLWDVVIAERSGGKGGRDGWAGQGRAGTE